MIKNDLTFMFYNNGMNKRSTDTATAKGTFQFFITTFVLQALRISVPRNYEHLMPHLYMSTQEFCSQGGS